MKTQAEKKQIQQIALYSFLVSLPVSAGASLVVNGDTVLWAKLQNVLRFNEAHAQISYTGPNVWTNAPTLTLTVTQPVPIVTGDSGDSGDSG